MADRARFIIFNRFIASIILAGFAEGDPNISISLTKDLYCYITPDVSIYAIL